MINDMILKNVNVQYVDKFKIRENGIQIIENDSIIEIYNDVFRTIPLFITRENSGKLLIFSNFEDFYAFNNIDRDIDKTGFWEIILFGSALWTRTLYKNVQQMPSASKIIINKKTNEYHIERYWDFNIEEDESIDSMQKAAEGLYERLDTIFSKLDKTQKYVMGMSGGMDSRITLAFLSKYISKENLELFTYGFDENLLEYKYACEVAEMFGYHRPKFHKLTKNSYINAMDYLPKMSGGQIAVNHCHILDFLKNNDLINYKHISTYYSDAILGWDTKKTKSIQNIEENFYIQIVKKCNFLSTKIKENIKNDSIKIYESFNVIANYSSRDEYKYVTERNQKFHTYLASIQNIFLPTLLPFADYELLKYAQSIPLEYKYEKRLIDYILSNNFQLQNLKDISSRFQWGSKFSNLMEWYSFRFLNRTNAILRPLTKGYIQLFNKYQTEEQERLLYRYFYKDLKEATEKFVQLKLMTPEQKKLFDKLPLRANGVGERYQLISLKDLV